MTDKNHPVWEVYDLLRTTRLNVKYYSGRLKSVERTSFILELVMLVAAPGSAVAGLWFWTDEYGKLAWKWLGAVAALVAVVKPLLNLTHRIKEYEAVLSGYRGLEHDLRELRTLIAQDGKFGSKHKAELQKAMTRSGALSSRSPDTGEDKSLLERCFDEVAEEFPKESFFVPAER